jgi:fused signal recognition particle receptor
MGLFAKFKAGLQKTHAKLTHEIKRIITRSPKLTAESLEEIEHALIAADLGLAMTAQITGAVKKAFETQGGAGLDYLAIARAEIEKSLSANKSELKKMPHGPTVVCILGGKRPRQTTTPAQPAPYF